MSSDATEAKEAAIDISPSNETDNASLDNMFDVKSYLPDSEEETLSTPKLTNDSKGKIPKIKSMNNQEFPKPGLNKPHGNFTLPTLRPRRKRSSTNTCVCM